MLNKIVGFLLLVSTLNAIDVPISKVKKEIFYNQIEVNSQIVQLSNSKESIMAQIGGKVLKYFVKQGQKIKKGQPIALVESLELSSLFSELKSLRKQLSGVNKNYTLAKKLYSRGLETLQNINSIEIKRDELISKIEGIKEKLSILGVKGKKAKSTYRLYAKGKGVVSKILAPIHSVVTPNTPLVSIIKGGSSYLVKSFIPLRYVSKVQVGDRGEIEYGGAKYPITITQILPKLDIETQQMVVLSTIDKSIVNLFIGAYVDTTLNIGKPKEYLAIKKSALSFFNNEWVVFVPNESDKKEEKKDKEEDEEIEVPFDIKVIKIITQNSKFVAIEGINENEEYVSAKSYFVKSLLLKSSLGDGD